MNSLDCEINGRKRRKQSVEIEFRANIKAKVTAFILITEGFLAIRMKAKFSNVKLISSYEHAEDGIGDRVHCFLEWTYDSLAKSKYPSVILV